MAERTPVWNWRRTKIVATLGPASDDYETLLAMVEAGLDVARLNMSHGDIASHYERVEKIRRASRETGRTVSILADLCGPKIRIGSFGADQVSIVRGETFTLTTREVVGDETRVTCRYRALPQDVSAGSLIYLADGLIQLRVKKVDGEDVICEVMSSGVLSEGKGLNLPGTRLSTPSLTEKDREDLEGILKADIDFVALSFVRSPDEVHELKALIENHGGDVAVVAKIEKPEAVNCLEEIVEASDAVMVARGDLGVETSVEAMPILQKKILKEAIRQERPAITATQMLESMVTNPRPTRAEASDVANAVYDGTDAVMLSGETAAGSYPVEAVRTMARICEVTEPQVRSWRDQRVAALGFGSDREALAAAATLTARRIGAKAICAFTKSGASALAISKCRPETPIIALTPSEKLVRRLNLCWGVYPFVCPVVKSFEEILVAVRGILLREVGLKPGDPVCLVAGMPVGVPGQTNTLYIKRLNAEGHTYGASL